MNSHCVLIFRNITKLFYYWCNYKHDSLIFGCYSSDLCLQRYCVSVGGLLASLMLWGVTRILYLKVYSVCAWGVLRLLWVLRYASFDGLWYRCREVVFSPIFSALNLVGIGQYTCARPVVIVICKTALPLVNSSSLDMAEEKWILQIWGRDD